MEIDHDIIIIKEYDGKRFDLVSTILLKNEFSREEIQTFIKNSQILLNNIQSKLSTKLKTNDIINIKSEIYHMQVKNKQNITSVKMDLDIVFENENLIIINKAAGLTVHPGAGNIDNTLVNGLKYHFDNNLSNERGEDRAGIVHRLDKNTSGLMIIAKNNKAHRLLSEMFANHTIKRTYVAICCGLITPTQGKIENKLIKDPKHFDKIAISKTEDGKIAITNYKIKKLLFNGKFSLVECQLETGRTHQIRVHLASIDHPIVGDVTYANVIDIAKWKNIPEWKHINRHLLHSSEIEFIEPITKEEIKVYRKADFFID